MAVRGLSANSDSLLRVATRLLGITEGRLRLSLFKSPLVLNSFGGFAIAVATMFLAIAYFTEHEMLKAFWLGAFTTTLLGSVSFLGTTKVAALRAHQREARLQRDHDRMLRQLVDASPTMVSYVDREERIRLANSAFEKWLGVARNELHGRHIRDVLGEGPYQAVQPQMKRVWQGESVRFERLLPALDGGCRYVDSMLTPHFGDDGEVEGIFEIIVDITDRKRIEDALRESEERYRTLVETSPVCILEMNLGGHLETLNLAGRTMIGEDDRSHVFGLSFIDIVAPSDRQRISALLARTRDGETTQAEFGVLIENERRVFSASFLPLKSPEGSIQKIMGVMQDITDAHLLADELSYRASYDALTGLVNRREFEQRLERILETARAEKTENTFCYLDLDRFKVINDSCGHLAGDELLRQIAALLQENVRQRDTLARLGGDEFGVLMEHCSIEQAKRVADKLRKKVEDLRFVWAKKTFGVGVSIGIVSIDETSESGSAVMNAADSACYTAKNRGRNQIHVFRHSNTDLVRRHGDVEWVIRVQEALRDDGFQLDYQTIIPVTDRFEDGKHVELLLRLSDGKGEPVPPGAFLPAAERYNLSTKIDRWVIRNALAWFKANPEVLERIATCSINLSAQSLIDPRFLSFVIDMLETDPIPAEKLCFEITESAATANLTDAARFMSTLGKLGCRFALDDFGSGHSSFTYLRTLPVHFLKIDGIYIKGIVDDPLDMAIVRSINDIAQTLELHTIAEYVESQPVAMKLRELGIDYYQGNFVAEPRPIDQLARDLDPS
ncbi:MAG: EAL domain-containing protein [Gammaproteobacteria bacterium]|nr:EAL domain-containing protein [Gammaproteobacteria bacterium]NIW55265.1 EAL domain-containing protein [Gammaproteobacteria bacterium]